MSLEVRPPGSAPVHPDFEQIRWGTPSGTDTDLDSTVDAWLSQLGAVGDGVVDLVRLAGSAYVADRLQPRRTGFSRTIRIHVHLVDAAGWTPLLPQVERLLGWISGDLWQLSATSDKARRPAGATQPSVPSADTSAVALLSGGLDSFSSAVLNTTTRLFVSHTDNPTVTGAQSTAWTWLTENDVRGERVRVTFCEAGQKRESTTRTRALLFYALAVALADARGLDRVEVPENGFTGINLALGNDRGGVLSTRSTHPWTMQLTQALMDDAGIQVSLANPYEWRTKGELVRAASDVSSNFADGLAKTLSCAKLDGGRYKGGNPNWNCGLCVACITRRASIRAAGITDDTPYLATRLAGASLAHLRTRRGPDVRAVMARIESDVDEFVLLENGPYPDAYDFEAAVDLCGRGYAELAAVLPELSW